MSVYETNDGRFPDESDVETRYPLTEEQYQGDRAAWPWVAGYVLGQCGPDEWDICVDGAPPSGYEHGEPVYPCVFRDASEIRRVVKS